MRYYIIAGERSGDLHAGNLIRSLKSFDHTPQMRGIGGDQMKSEGVDLIIHYGNLAFMGLWEVIVNLRTISQYLKECKSDILSYKPDVVILVDYGGFNTKIAKFANENGIKVFFYITPKVWAWHQQRAVTLKRVVDRMFVILPFEKDFFKKFNWEVDYVGNPVLDAIKAHLKDLTFTSRYGFVNDRPIVALLPGSRRQELKTILPLMADTVSLFPHIQFGLATVDNIETGAYDIMRNKPNVTFIENDTYNLLLHSRAAVVTSGTATLETALLHVPQVVVYKTSAVTYHVVRRIIKVGFLSLVNLIAGKKVVTELIQSEANPRQLKDELTLLLNEGQRRTSILEEYNKIYKLLDIGSASENAARLMWKYLNEKPESI
ncbi:MAG TPA: lipid-A-disaccharide synthase [Chryseosolibacter sp.]|nr:lipid-A-disaccharide synthase [Chryseosolibacter sp.]